MFLERRILRQSDKVKAKIKDRVRPTLFHASEIEEQMRFRGFVILPQGSNVLVEVLVEPLKSRERHPTLGGFELVSDMEGEVHRWDPAPINSDAPRSSAVTIRPTSLKVRELYEEWIQAGLLPSSSS